MSIRQLKKIHSAALRRVARKEKAYEHRHRDARRTIAASESLLATLDAEAEEESE